VLCEWLEGREPVAPPRATSHGESAAVLGRLILPLPSERRERERDRFQKATTIAVFPRPRQWIPSCRTWCPM
jgi:hypothetical protein